MKSIHVENHVWSRRSRSCIASRYAKIMRLLAAPALQHWFHLHGTDIKCHFCSQSLSNKLLIGKDVTEQQIINEKKTGLKNFTINLI
jgi:hypothetical protein